MCHHIGKYSVRRQLFCIFGRRLQCKCLFNFLSPPEFRLYRGKAVTFFGHGKGFRMEGSWTWQPHFHHINFKREKKKRWWRNDWWRCAYRWWMKIAGLNFCGIRGKEALGQNYWENNPFCGCSCSVSHHLILISFTIEPCLAVLHSILFKYCIIRPVTISKT